MGEERLGRVTSGSNKDYEAKRNPSDKEVYVKGSGGGWTRVGGDKPRNASEALNMAAAFVSNR